ncbi:MAG TPA: hypothetical protein VL727_18710 [Puia sp.]|nr:hypothetical protein [Puia sp.]
MNKTLSPNRLVPLFSLLLIAITSIGLSGCGPEGDKNVVVLPAPNDTTIEHHAISIDLARQLAASFRASIDSFNKSCPNFKDSMQFGHAESFPTDVFVKLLREHNEKQGSAKGIRIYFGRGPGGEIKLILVPYDKNGNDMIDHLVDINGNPAPGTTPIKTEELKSGVGQVVEQGQRCPTVCDDGGSGLN